MTLPIVVYGSPILRNRSEALPAGEVDTEVVKLAGDMFDTMYAAEGVGLAAPQIGRNIRLFVIDISPWADDEPELKDFKRTFINPEIYWSSEETDYYNEGCLSLPGINEDVLRPVTIKMRYLDERYTPHDEEFTGRAARVIQHEYDHLEGAVFTDRLTPLRRSLLKRKLEGFAKGKYFAAYRTK